MAQNVEPRKYGESTTILFDLYQPDGVNLEPAATFAVGDVKIMKDEGVEANTTNLPTDEGQTYSLVLTATEMQAARIKIIIVDQTATKVWLDTTVKVETYGNASAQHAFDLDTATQAVNVIQISGDTTAADNLELQYDTTGLTGDTFPATQSQLSRLTNVGSAVHSPADSYVLTTGTLSSGTVASTEPLDGVYHIHTDSAGALDLYYEFNLGSGVPSSVQVTAYLTGVNDSVGIYGYDWVAASWVQIGTISGTATSTDQINSYDLYVNMVGIGVDKGKVRIRFYEAAGLTSATLGIDQIFVAFSQGQEGYENAAIWFDSTASNTNTVVGIDGTSRNPVSTEAAVNTLLSSANLKRVEVYAGSSITFSTSHTDEVWSGPTWTLALGGQDISGGWFRGAYVSGIGTGTESTFEDCHVGAVTIDIMHLIRCGLESTVTIGAAGDQHLDQCYSLVAGTSTPTINVGAAIANTNLSLRHYSGGVEFQNLGQLGTDNVTVEGNGQVVLNANCIGGIVAIRGNFDLTDNSSTTTIVDTARYDREDQSFDVWDEILIGSTHNIADSAGKRLRDLQEYGTYSGGFIFIDTVNGTAGTTDYESGTYMFPVDSIADANTIATSLGLARFDLAPQSNITFAASQVGQVFVGEDWFLNLGGQDISNSYFRGAQVVTGTGTTPTGEAHFVTCEFGNVTIGQSHLMECGLNGTLTITAGAVYTMDACYSQGAVSSPPVIDFGAGVGSTNLNIRKWSGDVEIQNLGSTGTDEICLDGDFHLHINANCVGGTINARGGVQVTDNSGGAVTIVYDDNTQNTIDILADTNEVQGKLPTNYLMGSSVVTDKDDEIDAIKAKTDNLPTAAEYAYIISNSADGVPITFSGGTTTTAVLATVDGAAASTIDDFYNGRILVFNSGTLKYQVTDITDYDGATKTATVTAVTTAIGISHTANMK